MIDEVVPGLFRMEIPLPKNPLKYVNSYVIKDPDWNLVIDTGLNQDECYEAMIAGLAELSVDLEKTKFFITHLHADHFGLVDRLVKDPSQIFFSRPEMEIIESWSGWEPMVQYAALNGFPENLLRAAIDSHPGFKHKSGWVPGMKKMGDGDRIEIGDFSFTCVETPGHTLGHLCLYESRKKLLVSGDHILGDITPNIQCWSDRDNNLNDYLRSLDKVGQLDVELTLPGHRTVIRDVGARIEELKAHHGRRCDEVVSILSRSGKSAFETAAMMSWDLSGTWEDFPLPQKWFATAEATAHLRYLEEKDVLARNDENGHRTYHLKEAA